MTRDEMRELIAEGTRETFTHYAKNINWPDEDDRQAFCDDIEADVAEAVLAAFAARGIVLGERAGLTEEEDRTLARCIADADKNTLADPSFSALDDLLLIGLPSVGLALVRVVE